MTSSFFNIFRYAWLRFFRFPSGQTTRKLSRDELSLVIPVTPLVGAVAGFLIWAVLTAAQRIAGRTAAAILGATVIPPVLEYVTGEQGVRSLFGFLRQREQGSEPMQILRTGLDEEAEVLILPKKLLVPSVLLLFRSCLYAVLCLQHGGVWFLFTWTGVFLLFAELSLIPSRITGYVSCPVRKNRQNFHVFCAAGIFLIAGLASRELLFAGIGFFASWGLARGAAVLQGWAGGKIDRAVMALYGSGAEILLLFLGVLLFAD